VIPFDLMRYDGKWYELPRQDGESVAAFL